MTRYMKDGTVPFGTGLLILGLYMLKSSMGWGVYGPEGPGPGFFPLVYGLIMVVFSSILVVQTIRSRHAAGPVREPASDQQDRGGTLAALTAWVALMASVPLMAYLGFIVGFGLALFFIIRVVFTRPTLQSAIVAGSIVTGLYIAFSVLLGLVLPTSKYWGF